MHQVKIAIAVAEAEDAIQTLEADLAGMVRAAMRATYEHWLVTDEDDQFLAAVAAVMEHYGKESPEGVRLASEIGQDTPPQGWRPIGLTDLWRQVKRERTRVV
jgi:hypothetical protein